MTIRMLPLICMMLIIIFEVIVFERKMPVTKLFSIISIISNFYTPLKNAVIILDNYWEYCYAANSMNKMFFGIENRDIREFDSSLQNGEIVLKSAVYERNEEISMLKAIQVIYGKHLNLIEKISFSKKGN